MLKTLVSACALMTASHAQDTTYYTPEDFQTNLFWKRPS